MGLTWGMMEMTYIFTKFNSNKVWLFNIVNQWSRFIFYNILVSIKVVLIVWEILEWQGVWPDLVFLDIFLFWNQFSLSGSPPFAHHSLTWCKQDHVKGLGTLINHYSISLVWYLLIFLLMNDRFQHLSGLLSLEGA